MREQHLTRYFIDQLTLADHGAIELSKAAVERSQNENVKEFAQRLIEDHTKLDKQLKSLSSGDSRDEVRTGEVAGRHDIVTQLCMINHRAADNVMKRSQRMLDKYQGQDFDMAYLGLVIGEHNWLAAQLEAVQNVGTPEFQSIAEQAAQTVGRHLEQALALSKQLEDDRERETTRTGERTQQ